MATIGILFTILSAKNSYSQRSPELVDKYEESSFDIMKLEKKYGAKYLLKQSDNEDYIDCLAQVLNF